MKNHFWKLFNPAVVVCLGFLLLGAISGRAQKLDLAKVGEILDKTDCANVAANKIKICNYDFQFENRRIEALIIQPTTGEKLPGVMLAPGFNLTARDLIPFGVMLAHEGFASIAVTPPGFGKSTGKADFVGENTIAVFTAAWNNFKKESFIDANKMMIYGHSRGGMAAALLAIRLKDAKAAVLASGIYDFKLAAEDVQLAGMRERMIIETAMNETAFAERSMILHADELQTPVLILHGARDEKISVNQAYNLRDRLLALKKDFEIKIYPEHGHLLDIREVVAETADFFRRKLK